MINPTGIMLFILCYAVCGTVYTAWHISRGAKKNKQIVNQYLGDLSPIETSVLPLIFFAWPIVLTIRLWTAAIKSIARLFWV